jgi:hypothetical protein
MKKKKKSSRLTVKNVASCEEASSELVLEETALPKEKFSTPKPCLYDLWTNPYTQTTSWHQVVTLATQIEPPPEMSCVESIPVSEPEPSCTQVCVEELPHPAIVELEKEPCVEVYLPPVPEESCNEVCVEESPPLEPEEPPEAPFVEGYRLTDHYDPPLKESLVEKAPIVEAEVPSEEPCMEELPTSQFAEQSSKTRYVESAFYLSGPSQYNTS